MLKKKDFFIPWRYAVQGQKLTPGLFLARLMGSILLGGKTIQF
jgi:hypothetical protein